MKYFFVLVCMLAQIIYADDISSSKASAKSLGNTAASKFNSKSKLKSNALNPMQGSGALTTVDNSTTFDGAISCFDKEIGLTTTYSVSSSSISLTIKQDSNLDKLLDHTLTISGIIGVCQNGVVTGDWNNPIYKSFSVSNSKLSVTQLAKEQMHACFCTNSSCSYTFDSNVYKTIDGGINAILSANNINISGDNEWDSGLKKSTTYFNYPTSCQSNVIPNKYTNTDPRNYYHSQSANDFTDSVSAVDGQNSKSIYNAALVHSATTIPQTNNSMSVNYKSLNECTKEYKFEKNQVTNTIDLKLIDSCGNFGSCTIRTKQICNSKGSDCQQVLFKGVSSTFNKTFCSEIVLDKSYEVCDSSSGIEIKDSTGNILSTYTDKHLYEKYTYDCGSKTATADFTQTNELDTDGKGHFKYKDGTQATINGLPTADLSCKQKFCTTKKSIKDTDVHSDSSQDNTTRNEMNVKVCIEEISGSYTCPLEAGESIVDQCSCDVPQTMSNKTLGELSAIEEMIDDFTCSQ